ncbi:tRNA pseudouridine(38-40) synthase TruA [Holospora undulata]|uniref:tRNA pseudouridine synthase A n=1 Tax=Holospora undulata HU1 TaxID=1321371 RepID=A0A061JHG9_9PROT|nr:tRNA pseudouridine(38-40) synthase TruA [Holospora undulata]ETZ04738.1 tRNA pseudouridine synthase A [Holospora undulata HU1]
MSVRYALHIEYDGGFFSGWQSQNVSPLSVQKTLEQVFFKLTQETVSVYAAGRTDSGVHAKGQVAHVDFAKVYTKKRIFKGGNYYLKNSGVQILDVKIVDKAFHARFSAKSRVYKYILLTRPSDSPLWKSRAWWVNRPIHMTLLQDAAEMLKGTKDFSNFRNSSCQASNPVRTLDQITIEDMGSFLCLRFQAKSFLHRQVRMMTGAMVYLAARRISTKEFSEYLSPGNDGRKPFTAPAHGLYLENIIYDDFIF